MREKVFIYAGLLIFLVLITFPFTYNLVAGNSSSAPELELPEQEEECVAQTDYMKSSHMKLLVTWRDDSVRNNIRSYTSFNGKAYDISFTDTCLTQCHTSKADFCDRCHEYVGVEGPFCMDCHIDPEEIQGSGQ